MSRKNKWSFIENKEAREALINGSDLLNTMKKLINGERYNQEIAMHTGYHLQITATEAAYLVSGGRYFTRTDDLEYRGRVMQHPGMRDYLASELKKRTWFHA